MSLVPITIFLHQLPHGLQVKEKKRRSSGLLAVIAPEN
jgi:hypothetical protein